MSDVKLPGIGNVPKPALIAVGVASVGILAYAWYRHSNAAPVNTSASTNTPSDTSIDPATGVPYADEFGYTNSGYGFPGIYDPSTGSTIGTGVGTGTVTTVTTNAAWSQAAQSYLASIGGFDATAVAAALGAGLLGHYMTPDQVGIWNAAIAFEGNPPNGYPPLNTIPPIGNPPPSSLPPAPAGFHITGTTKSSVGMAWTAVPGAMGYHIKVTGGGLNHTVVTHNLTYSVSALHKSTTYTFYVMAYNAAGTGAASSHLSAKTKAK